MGDSSSALTRGGPTAAVKRQQEADLTVLMGALGRVSEQQLQVFFVTQSFITRFAAKADGLGRLVDADVADAVAAIAASFETASRGVLYEHPSTSPTGESLRRELKEFLAKVGRGAGTLGLLLRARERGTSPIAFRLRCCKNLEERFNI